MEKRYGYPLTSWNSAKDEMREILIERARLRGMIPYSDLVAKIRSIQMDPHSEGLRMMLGEISHEEADAGRGMLTVIVVHKSGDMQPGPGFFDLAAELGRDTSDVLQCWVDELKFVHSIWS